MENEFSDFEDEEGVDEPVLSDYDKDEAEDEVCFSTLYLKIWTLKVLRMILFIT